MKKTENTLNIIKDTNFDGLPSNTNIAKTIKPINKYAIHRICSGQVVLSLATAVKELVENSLDAGAKSIDIRLKNSASSTIEVSDDGRGICPADFEQFAMKHCTSKLEDFEDLVDVNTFGFRGEAISSLCALSNLSVITRHETEAVGRKLGFDHFGKIKKQSSVARKVGTTILVEKLFSTLPVRHKEFLRNIKKEFNKMVQILYSYCIISTNVRISCINCDNGKKTTVVATDVYPSIRDNLSSIFGPKQVTTLLQIKGGEVCSSTLAEYGLTSTQISDSVQLDGYISSCAHGAGRSSVDRQFYFINSRPCDPSKVSRLVNDIYHQYNKYQYPMIVLNIKIKADDVDINVTPDKRCIFTSKEKHLLALIKGTLINMYEKIPSTYVMQNTLPNTIDNYASFSPLNATNSIVITHTLESPLSKVASTTGKRLASLAARFSRQSSTFRPNSSFSSTTKRSLYSDPKKDDSLPIKQRKLDNYFDEKLSSANENDTLYILTPENNTELDDFTKINNEIGHETPVSNGRLLISEEDEKLVCKVSLDNKLRKSCEHVNVKTDIFLDKLKNKIEKQQMQSNYNCSNTLVPNVCTPPDEEVLSKGLSQQMFVEVLDNFEVSSSKTKSLQINFSLYSLKSKLNKNTNNSNEENICRKFRAKIDTNENDNAENELKKEIRKEHFKKMTIVGQFNLGFIIVRLDSDLFIVDQHATDEKYNFEQLEKNHILLQQPMIAPQQLQLTPVNELILLDNLQVFRQNGFHFDTDESSPVGRRVSLISVPHSRGWEFGLPDIEELIFMLSDAPNALCRPSRVRTMLASRACRQSIMIGTALSSSQMKKLIQHMGEIDHPWNCPHGRPTMRHLINIDMISGLL